jgi:hypothetical protein
MPGARDQRQAAPGLSERLQRLDALADPRIARDLEVIGLQLARAEGILLGGGRDVRRPLRIIAQRIDRAERRVAGTRRP